MCAQAEAERIVLAANDNAGMRTCSIRVTAIYGEYDNDQIPGFMGVLREGRQRFQIGNGESRVSWLCEWKPPRSVGIRRRRPDAPHPSQTPADHRPCC